MFEINFWLIRSKFFLVALILFQIPCFLLYIVFLKILVWSTSISLSKMKCNADNALVNVNNSALSKLEDLKVSSDLNDSVRSIDSHFLQNFN